jgi:hypothetical protein
LRGLLRTVLPGGVVLLAAVAAVLRLEEEQLVLVTGPYEVVLYAAGALLAIAFHRSRVVTGLGMLAAVALLGGPFVPLATMLIATLGVLATMRDRGVLSRGGLIQVVGVVSVAIRTR